MKRQIPHPFALSTERLSIRSPDVADAPQMVEAIAESIDALRPWMPWADHVPSLEEARENCRQAEQAFRDGEDFRLHVFLKASGVYLGGSGLHRFDWSVPRCEIGYWIRTSLGGRGYVTEAVAEIARYALTDLGVNRVEIRMNADNVRSRRVPERLGFAFEGTLRSESRHVDGTLCDTCIYAKIRE